MFDSAFLAKLERLHLLSRRTFNGQNRAERRSRRSGSSLEFADYRNYTPGDDLRSVDWNIYGRLDRLFLKVFEEEEDLPIHLLLDASASMRWTPTDGAPRPTKLDVARRIAGTLAYIGLASLDRVNVGWFGEQLGPDLGSGRGKGHFHRVVRFLERPPSDPGGPTDLARSLRAFGQRTKRRGLVIVLSDFFDARGYDEALSFLLHQRFELQLVQVLDPAELKPSLLGDLKLTDAETGGAYDVTVNEGLVRAYEREVGAFLSGLETFCRRRRIGYRRTTTDVPFEDFVLGTLRTNGGLVR